MSTRHNGIDVIGDTHGSFHALAEWTERGDAQTLIHVGDVGIGFSGVLDKCKSLGMMLHDMGKIAFFIRGNHDDPAYFDGRSYGNLHLVPDYSRIKTDTGSILCVGGGISLDRTARTAGAGYWPGERFRFDPTMIGDDPITHVVTHTANLAWTGLQRKTYFVDSWCKVDSTLREDIDEESNNMAFFHREIYDRGHRPLKWFYGHFHQSKIIELQGTTFIGLAENEIQPLSLQN